MEEKLPTRVTPLNIKDPEVYQMARQLADLSGETLTEAVRKSLRQRLMREQYGKRSRFEIERLREIADRVAALPVLDDQTDDEIIGYDERGVPSSA